MVTPLSDRERAVLYVIVPATVTAALIVSYFSGVPALQSLVSPAYHREFGLLENLQNLCLLALTVILIRGLRRGRSRVEQPLLWIVLAGTLVMLLEEMDYGLHIRDLVRGVRPDDQAFRNLHNLRSTRPLKQLADVVMIAYFGVFPLMSSRLASARLRALAPHRICIVTLIVSGVLTNVAHLVQDWTLQVGTISKNISEFTELNYYYLVTCYCWELTVRRLPIGTVEST